MFLGHSCYKFLKIIYLYEGGGKKLFHGHWLQHSSQTVLQEMSHPNSLFWLNECEDVPVSTIVQLCCLTKLAGEEPQGPIVVAAHYLQPLPGWMWLA